MKAIWKKLAAVSTAAVMCAGIGMLAACSGSGEAATGPQGPKGEDGTTPHIGTDGYWYIGDVKTQYKAQGETGATPTIEIQDGYWYINGNNTGVKAEGTDGTDGEDGEKGNNGTVVTIGKDGYWYLDGVKSDVVATGTAPTVTIESDGYWYINGVKQSIKAEGVMGTVWFTGRGLPTDDKNGADLTSAKDGDFYVNVNTNTIYTLNGTTWSVLVNVNEQHNVSVWDGTIPGWQAPNLSAEEIIKNRPVSYVVNEEAHTIDLYNAEAFAWFAYRAVVGTTGYDGYTVTLHCDIDLNNEMWIPIGLGARSNAAGIAFRGTFDGNGHTIKNLNGDKFLNAIEYGEYENILGVDTPTTETGYYINYVNGDVDVNIPVNIKEDTSGDEVNYGLFGNSYNATFKNLTVENVTVTTASRELKGEGERKLLVDSVGAFVGFGLGSITLENCTAGSINGNDELTVYSCVGGLVGRIYGGEGKDEDDIITGAIAPYGKIIFRNCTNYIDVELSHEKADKAGGFVGYPHRFSELIVNDCTNYGDVCGFYAGGFGAYRSGRVDMNAPTTINNFTNYGNITGNFAGGIYGIRDSGNQGGTNASFSINNAINYGTITAKHVVSNHMTSFLRAGGFFGKLEVKSARVIFNGCYNYGDIIIDGSSDTLSKQYAGGFVGELCVVVRDDGSKKQGGVIISGINMGDIIAVDSTAATINAYGCGYVDIESELEINAVYKQIYFFNSGTILNGEEEISDHENTNLSVYNIAN